MVKKKKNTGNKSKSSGNSEKTETKNNTDVDTKKNNTNSSSTTTSPVISSPTTPDADNKTEKLQKIFKKENFVSCEFFTPYVHFINFFVFKLVRQG